MDARKHQIIDTDEKFGALYTNPLHMRNHNRVFSLLLFPLRARLFKSDPKYTFYLSAKKSSSLDPLTLYVIVSLIDE